MLRGEDGRYCRDNLSSQILWGLLQNIPTCEHRWKIHIFKRAATLCRERYHGIFCILFRLQLQSDDIMIMQLDKERPTHPSPHVTLFVHYHIPQVNTIIPLIFPRISSLIKLPHHIINIINIILLSHRTSEHHYSSYFPLSHKYW